MSQYFDITSIVFLILAVAIFLRLRSVLGRKTGSEQSPFEPVDRSRAGEPAARPDNVIPLPTRAPQAETADANPSPPRYAPEGSALDTALRQVMSADRNFDPTSFVVGARQAYEMIVTAFAEGDRDTLKMLLARDVYDGFVSAIAAREAAGHKLESKFVGIDKADITEATVKGSTASISMRFVSQLVSVTRDAAGTVVDGDPVHPTQVIDQWTFARDVTSRDPNWKLVLTEAAD